MLPLILGIIGFFLYLVYDVNSYTVENRFLRMGFAAGSLLLAAATLLLGIAAWRAGAFHGGMDVILLLLGALAFGALIYCLFFALPFQETYTNPLNGRKTYTCGVYALCRHPGVLAFFAIYLFWGLAALPAPFLAYGLLFSVLNVGYAWFQDRVTFPKTFCDYHAYQSRTPFLIPNKKSVERAIKTWGSPLEKEAKL